MIAHKCDLNHANALPLMPTEFSSLFKRMVWSTLFLLRENLDRGVRILPFLVSLTENGDSRSVCNELIILGQAVFFFYERLNNSQFEGFWDINQDKLALQKTTEQ